MDQNPKKLDKRGDVLEYLRHNGPSLPIQIAKHINLSSLFAGAYLSELAQENQLKISDIKIGNSPLYYLKGQEPMLTKFSTHLKSKEKEAHDLLQQNKVLKESSQEPAIRVALKQIKDFAFPIQIKGENYWKYLTTTDQEVQEIFNPSSQSSQYLTAKQLESNINPSKPLNHNPMEVPTRESYKQQETPYQTIEELQNQGLTAEKLKEIAEQEITKELESEEQKTEEELPSPNPSSKTTNIDNPQIKILKSSQSETAIKTPIKKIKTKPTRKDPKQEFLDKTTRHLSSKQIKTEEILKNDKKQIIAEINFNNEKLLLVAFNKKRFDESDLLKIYKKYQDKNLGFYFIARGETSKKTQEIIRASKKLKAVDTFEEQ